MQLYFKYVQYVVIHIERFLNFVIGLIIFFLYILYNYSIIHKVTMLFVHKVVHLRVRSDIDFRSYIILSPYSFTFTSSGSPMTLILVTIP